MFANRIALDYKGSGFRFHCTDSFEHNNRLV